jgi:hypothetical protein
MFLSKIKESGNESFEDIFKFNESKELFVFDENLKITRNLPKLKTIKKFVLSEGVNINCVLEKSSLFKDYFFNKKLNKFQKRMYNHNFKVQTICNIIKYFPKKPSDVEYSFLEEQCHFLTTNTIGFSFNEQKDFIGKMYKSFESKELKFSKKKDPRLELNHLNPLYPYFQIKKSKGKQTKLTKNKKMLKLMKSALKQKILQNQCQALVSIQNDQYDHMKVEVKTKLERFAEPQKKFSEIWNFVKNSKKEKTKKKSKRNCITFIDDLKNIESLDSKVKVYNHMFRKQVPFAFIQNNQIGFDTFEIDIMKQVIL